MTSGTPTPPPEPPPLMQVRASGASDVGRTRSANEDAFHLGDSVFAVADGMGGHAAGEVASTTALEPIAELDARVFPDAETALASLRDAVVAANVAVVSKAEGDPSLGGMGTTLTAVMLEGRRLHVAHVGDSRAYLLRGDQFSQLTTDHTLVQRLIDEGRLSPEDAASHPKRSVITRAIGVERSIDVDAMSLDLQPGDRLLLCSDGLAGPVTDQEIADLLGQRLDLDATVAALIAAANDAGGPDNITAVLLEFTPITLPAADGSDEPDANQDDDADGSGEQTSSTSELPAAPITVNTRPASGDGDWAARLGRLGDAVSAADERAPRGIARSQRIAAIIITVGLLVGGVLAGGRWLLSRSYYVGVDDQDVVVIYQGVPVDLGPLPLSWEFEPTSLTLTDVPPLFHDALRSGVTATDLADARRIVANYRDAEDDPAPQDGEGGGS